MDASVDAYSDCSGSSESSETRSELEARIYSIVHHNDFTGTTGTPPSIDPRYGVEFSAAGEVIVYLRDPPPTNILAVDDYLSVGLVAAANSIIPTIVLHDEVMESCSRDDSNIDVEFVETSLKKNKKKKKNNKYLHDKTIDEYIEHVKKSNALEEYKEKSGLNKMKSNNSSSYSESENVALNVAFHNERAIPMKSNDVLKQYSIGKPTEDSLWYRCPKTWTSDMVTYYTKIQKSKRNFDCGEELRKIREKFGFSPFDWTLDPMDLYKSHSNTPRIRCNTCRQFGHTAYYCQTPYKPEICIMCGMEGHNFHSCNNKICLSCGTWQRKFTNNCSICVSMSKTKCNTCNTNGHESSKCTESWRQFHSIISTAPEPENNEFAQSTRRSNVEKRHSTMQKFSSAPSTPNIRDLSNKSIRTDESGKCKKAKRLQRLRVKKKKHSNKSPVNKNNTPTTPANESINIDVNIQDVTVKHSLTKKKFLKKKKFSV